MELMDVLSGDRAWGIHEGDVIPHMLEDMPQECVDLEICSVPFPQVFAYTDEACDLGNSEDLRHEAKLHFSWFFRGLARVMKPGRVAMIHCMQIALTKRSGGVGLFDFRGLLIRLGQRAGLTYEYDWLIRKNPQAQAIRTKKWELKFQGLESDRAQSRGSLGDYIIKFRKPGENAVPVISPAQVSRNDWIDWAEGCWSDIVETDTLNVTAAKGVNDTRHICPLQLGLIERLIRLYSNPGELVLDPFSGVGSTGYVCRGGISPKTKRFLAEPRRYYGAEIKPEYIATSRANLEKAESMHKDVSRTLFDALEVH